MRSPARFLVLIFGLMVAQSLHAQRMPGVFKEPRLGIWTGQDIRMEIKRTQNPDYQFEGTIKIENKDQITFLMTHDGIQGTRGIYREDGVEKSFDFVVDDRDAQLKFIDMHYQLRWQEPEK